MANQSPTKMKEDDDETAAMVQETISKIKSQGVFDQFRKECLADVDNKPAAQNLHQRVEGFVKKFLGQQKWSPRLNKNQMRDHLRKQINQTDMLTQGVERIIEQVVNPKVLQVIKPRVDEAVCETLGLSLKEWKEENIRRKAELFKKLQEAAHQAKIDATIKEIQQKQLEKAQEHQLVQQSQAMASSSAATLTGLTSGVFGCPPPGMFHGQDGGWDFGSNAFFPLTPFNSPFGFSSMGQQGFPPYMQGWGAGGAGLDPFQPPPAPSVPVVPSAAPIIPAPFPPALPPASVPPPIPKSPHPGMSHLPPTDLPPLPPPEPTSEDNGLGALSPDPPPPGTETALSIISLPPTIMTPKKQVVSPAPTIHSFLSPRLLAEAMIESPQNKMLSKWEEKEAKRQARVQEEKEWKRTAMADISATRNLSFSHQAHLVAVKDEKVQARPDVNSKVCIEVKGSKAKPEAEQEGNGQRRYNFAWDKEDDEVSDITISSVHTSDLSSFSEPDLDTEEKADDGLEAVSDEEEPQETDDVIIAPSKDLEDVSSGSDFSTNLSDESEHESTPVKSFSVKLVQTPVRTPLRSPVQTPEAKPRKLLALSYNYSDSEDEETREERKARIAREKEERYLKRQARRAEMEVKRKEREEERARQQEEKKKVQEPNLEVLTSATLEATVAASAPEATAVASADVTAETPAVDINETDAVQKDQQEQPSGEENAGVEETPVAPTPKIDCYQTASSSAAATSSQDEEGMSASTPRASTPRKKHKTKEQLKEQLMQQKVEQRRAMRSRRQRTLNRRYASDEFTSIFTENRNLAPHLGLAEPNQEVVEQTVEVDTTVDMEESAVFIHEVEVQEECVVETETVPHPEAGEVEVSQSGIIEVVEDSSTRYQDSSKGRERQSSRVSSPYSDISSRESQPSRSSVSSQSSLSSSSSSLGSPERSPSPKYHRRTRQYSSDRDHGSRQQPHRQSSLRLQSDHVATRSSSRQKNAPEPAESRSRTSQRYSTDDLYKPRTSHRRPLTPPAAFEISYDSRAQSRRGSSYRADCHGPSQTDRCDGPVTAQHGQPEASEVVGRPVTPSIMADLELEPVSPDDDSLDKVLNAEETEDIQEGGEVEAGEVTEMTEVAAEEEPKSEKGGEVTTKVPSLNDGDDDAFRDGPKNTPSFAGEVLQSVEEGKKEEGEKEEGEEEDNEEGEDNEESEKRRKSRVPIELVDFGEAARHARSSAPSVTGSSGVGVGVSVVGGGACGWSKWRQDGRGGYTGGVGHSTLPAPPPPSVMRPTADSSYVYDRSKLPWTLKSGDSSQPYSSAPFDRSKMRWVAPHLRNTGRSSGDGSDVSGSASKPVASPRGSDRGAEDRHSSLAKDDIQGSASEASSSGVGRNSSSLPQRPLYSPINDSSSSLGSVASPEQFQEEFQSPPRQEAYQAARRDDYVAPIMHEYRSPTPRKERKRKRSSSSSSVESSSESSSVSSTSSSSSTPSRSRPVSYKQTKPRKKKEAELSEGEVSSVSSTHSVHERYRYENLPKAVARYQTPSVKSVSIHSLGASDISSNESDFSVEIRTQSSLSVRSRDHRNVSPTLPKQYSDRKPQSVSALPLSVSPERSSHKKKRRKTKSRHRHSGKKKPKTSSLSGESRRHKLSRRQRSSSQSSESDVEKFSDTARYVDLGKFSDTARYSEISKYSEAARFSPSRFSDTAKFSDVANFSPTRSVSPPTLGAAGSMSPISANSLSDIFPEDTEAVSPPPRREQYSQPSLLKGLDEDSRTPPPRDPYSPFDDESLSPPPLPDDLPPPPPGEDELPPLPADDRKSVPPPVPEALLKPPLPSLKTSLPLMPAGLLRQPLPAALQSGDLLSLPRESLPPLPLDLMSALQHEPSPPLPPHHTNPHPTVPSSRPELAAPPPQSTQGPPLPPLPADKLSTTLPPTPTATQKEEKEQVTLGSLESVNVTVGADSGDMPSNESLSRQMTGLERKEPPPQQRSHTPSQPPLPNLHFPVEPSLSTESAGFPVLVEESDTLTQCPHVAEETKALPLPTSVKQAERPVSPLSSNLEAQSHFLPSDDSKIPPHSLPSDDLKEPPHSLRLGDFNEPPVLAFAPTEQEGPRELAAVLLPTEESKVVQPSSRESDQEAAAGKCNTEQQPQTMESDGELTLVEKQDKWDTEPVASLHPDSVSKPGPPSPEAAKITDKSPPSVEHGELGVHCKENLNCTALLNVNGAGNEKSCSVGEVTAQAFDEGQASMSFSVEIEQVDDDKCRSLGETMNVLQPSSFTDLSEPPAGNPLHVAGDKAPATPELHFMESCSVLTPSPPRLKSYVDDLRATGSQSFSHKFLLTSSSVGSPYPPPPELCAERSPISFQFQPEKNFSHAPAFITDPDPRVSAELSKEAAETLPAQTSFEPPSLSPAQSGSMTVSVTVVEDKRNIGPRDSPYCVPPVCEEDPIVSKTASERDVAEAGRPQQLRRFSRSKSADSKHVSSDSLSEQQAEQGGLIQGLVSLPSENAGSALSYEKVPKSPSSVKSTDSTSKPPTSPSSEKSADSEEKKGRSSARSSPHSSRSSSPKPPPSLPRRRETRASSSSSQSESTIVTRRRTSASQPLSPATALSTVPPPAALVPQRETRRSVSRPATPPVRGLRRLRDRTSPSSDDGPPSKRARSQ